MPRPVKQAEPNVLFVGGYGRSGSTIIELLLSNADGVVVLGEVRHLFGRVVDDRELCSCGHEVGSCPHWNAVLDLAFPGGVDRDRILAAFRRINRVAAAPQLLVPFLRTPKMRRDLALYVLTFDAIYAAAAKTADASVVVDSSKYPLHGLAIMLGRADSGSRLRSMLLVRDPRAVAHSWENPKRRPEIAHEVRMMPRRNAVRSALAWLASNTLTRLIRGRRQVGFRVQRYEDFVAEPLAQLRQMVEFGGGKAGAISEDVFEVSRTDVHTIAGNPLESLGSTVEVRANDGWRAAMPGVKQWLVTAICLPQMARYGYLRRR